MKVGLIASVLLQGVRGFGDVEFCQTCAADFVAAGGCEASNPDDFIPAGCDPCGEAAAIACGDDNYDGSYSGPPICVLDCPNFESIYDTYEAAGAELEAQSDGVYCVETDTASACAGITAILEGDGTECNDDCSSEDLEDVADGQGILCFLTDLKSADGACEYLDSGIFFQGGSVPECTYAWTNTVPFEDWGNLGLQPCFDWLSGLDGQSYGGICSGLSTFPGGACSQYCSEEDIQIINDGATTMCIFAAYEDSGLFD